MFGPDLLGALSALASAFSWGGGDFSGGVAARRYGPFQVLVLSAATSLPLIVLLDLLAGEGLPSLRSGMLAAVAGACGTLGLAAFYRGLAIGRVAVVAPLASVLGTVVPVLVGVFDAGLPSAVRLAGFALALAGIWLVTGSNGEKVASTRREIELAILAGIGFGIFLTLIALVDPDEVFSPLVSSKIAGLLLCLWIVRARGLSVPSPRSSWAAVAAGILDTGGNVFYLLGTQMTRLDVVAALGSLYPAITVLLGWRLLKERVSRRQWLGVVVSLAAVILITL